jgi:hypothetical protein
MNTRRLTTILTTAYLSAMLATSVAPIRSDATPAVAQPTTREVARRATPKVDPVMTEELMARLIKYTRGLEGTHGVAGRICKVFDLCDGTSALQMKVSQSDSTDGKHYFGLPLDPASKDILIMVKHDALVESYLTDKTGKLRAAAVLDKDKEDSYLITNEKAAAKFKAELSLFAGEAATLPPTGTAAPARACFRRR